MPQQAAQSSEGPFALMDKFIGTRMDCDLAALVPGETVVVETRRRLHREKGYGYERVLWWIWLEDGRSAVSVPPGAGREVRKIAKGVTREQLFEAALAERLKAAASPALEMAGLGEIDRVLADVHFACDGHLLRRHRCGDCRRLLDESIPPAEGLKLPAHCFPDGIVYGVVAGGLVASFAFAHRIGLMEDTIADLGVDTAPAYRRRGYAKTVVSAVVEHVTRKGGQALYGCRPDNGASLATARSVGFVPYAKSLVLSKPARDLPD
jgi:GNAT superfamily N-acetyltransferase